MLIPKFTDEEFKAALERLRDVLDKVRTGDPPTCLDLCQFFDSRVCTDQEEYRSSDNSVNPTSSASRRPV